MTARLAGPAFAVVALIAGCAAGAEDPVASLRNGTVSAAAGLTGTRIGDLVRRPDLVLPDTSRVPFDLRARPAAEVTALYFGYTNCRDVCPTTMADLASAVHRLLPAEQARTRVVFVSEDPQRDTPAVLRAWLDRFDHRFVGLGGGDERTRRALAELKAPATETSPGPGAAGATVEHTGSVYVFRGPEVVVYTGGTTPAQYADDIRTLLSSP